MCKPLMMRVPYLGAGDGSMFFVNLHNITSMGMQVSKDGKQREFFVATASGPAIAIDAPTFDRMLDALEHFKSEIPSGIRASFPEWDTPNEDDDEPEPVEA